MAAGLIELGEIMLTQTERRLETASHNIANVSTPGFKQSVTFPQTIANAGAEQQTHARANFDQGALRLTGNPLDLALSGPGFFMLRGENGLFYSRNGQFQLHADGRVVNAQGLSLQTSDGADLILTTPLADIQSDGIVLEDGVPVARIGVFAPTDAASLETIGGTLFTSEADAMQESDAPLLRQGMLEASNVDLAAEMVGMMGALRQAEAGARVVQTYDSLMGQSISTFGRSGR